MIHLIPLPSLPTAFELAEALFQHVFRYYDIPKDIVSDRGPQFTSHIWTSLMEKLGVILSLTSGYHPQSNGKVNQELGHYLCIFCKNNQQDWSHYLPWAEYAHNSLRHSAMGLTPYHCVSGYQLPMFLWNPSTTDSPAAEEKFKQSKQLWESAYWYLEEVAAEHKLFSDHRQEIKCGCPFAISEGCLGVTNSALTIFKLLRVIKQINLVTYKIKLFHEFFSANSRYYCARYPHSTWLVAP